MAVMQVPLPFFLIFIIIPPMMMKNMSIVFQRPIRVAAKYPMSWSQCVSLQRRVKCEDQKSNMRSAAASCDDDDDVVKIIIMMH